jgi:hypothetical protein
MVTLIGIILLALGISLAVVWQPAVLTVLMGIIPLTLIVWGGIIVLIGYSEVKARREYNKAVGEADFENATVVQPKVNRGRATRQPATDITATPSGPNGASANTTASAAPSSPPNHSS